MRKASFYPRLAAQNIRKNGKFYLPYILTIIGASAAYYILSALVFDPGSKELASNTLSGPTYVKIFMSVGMVVAGLFSCIFLLYTNSFLMKRRQKELGLYNVLGMGKGNIAGMLCFESLYIAIIGIGGGLVVGILLHKLVAMLLYKMIRFPAPFGFNVQLRAVAVTTALFAGLIILTLITNLIRMKVSKPVELLRGGEVGEKEPKTRWILTIVGILTLAAGYFIAVATKDAEAAVFLYFVAVIAVIIGTYCLFTAVSVFVLKALRRNKGFYYKTSHFIGVSGMLHRMKRNAVGLANICILSTMVMVMISGTLSLYMGVEESLDQEYPNDMNVTVNYRPGAEEAYNPAAMPPVIDKAMRDFGISGEYKGAVTTLSFDLAGGKGGFAVRSGHPETETFVITVMTAADYSAASGTAPVILADDEILASSPIKLNDGTLGINFEDLGETMSFRVAGKLEDTHPFGRSSGYHGICYVVVANENVLLDIYQKQHDTFGDRYNNYLRWEGRYDLACTDEEAINFESGYWEQEPDYTGTGAWDILSVSVRASSEQEAYGLAGGFLFLGIFLGFVFIMATVLIIYYKQISEGYEDQRRFLIMRQVGLDEKQARGCIRSQILMVFFLPIIVAAVHMAFDFNMVVKLLSLFSLTNVGITALCTLGTLLVFAAVYAVVYIVTARAYYSIIRAQT